jgi:hypothetical protein
MKDVDGPTQIPDGSTSADDHNNVEPKSESAYSATDADPCSMSIDGRSQSTFKYGASAPNFSVSMVSSTPLSSSDTAHASDEPSVPTSSILEDVSSIRPPATASSICPDPPLATPTQATADVPTVARTSQEITLAELKAQKAAMLAALPAIQILMEETATSNADLSEGEDEPTDADIMAAANKIVKDHIKLLHEYNELKDVGQGLMGLIADQRGVRIVEVQEEFGIEASD